MDPDLLHPWNLSPANAIALQRKLAPKVVREDLLGPVQRIAGVDVGFEDDGRTTRAAVAVLRFPELSISETSISRVATTFPYVPGLLSFRETPAVLDALARLRRRPDLLACDGHGYAHPRRFGLACHLGLLADIPSIGIGKTRLLGDHDPVPDVRGKCVPLRHKGEVIGAVLRTRVGVKPVYVSIGHRISLASAVRFVLACSPRYKLPETTRQAHRLASAK